MKSRFWKGLLAAAVLGLSLSGTAMAQKDTEVISDGVFIGGKDVSGMTVEEAEAYVKEQVEALQDSVITLQMGEDTISKTWKELGLTWENKDLVNEISQIGTTGNYPKIQRTEGSAESESGV